MFGKTKSAGFNYIMAVKDYNTTVKAIEDGTLYVPFNKEIYVELFENQAARADNVKDLNKFIKTSKKDKKEVWHFWEGLITSGYTLVAVQYDEQAPDFQRLCNNDTLKFVSMV